MICIEATVYRLLKAHNLITSSAYVVIKPADVFHIQELVVPDGTPERTFGGDPDRVGMDLEHADAKPLQMRLAGRMIGELFRRGVGKSGYHGTGERAPAHVGERRVVDDVVGVPGAQQVEKVQPALALPRAKLGEIVIADMGAEPVPPGMPCAGVVHRHPGRCRKSRPQDLAALRKETLLSLDQQPRHLPLRNRHPEGPQLRRQPLHRHFPLVMQHQHETSHFRAEMLLPPAGSGAGLSPKFSPFRSRV